MRLLYDHQIFAMQRHGGVSRYFVELAKKIGSRSDIDLNLLAPLHFNRYLRQLDLDMTLGTHIPKFPLAGKIARAMNSAITQGWISRNKPEIIHSTYYFPFRRPANCNAKVVVTVHDMIHELYPDNFVSYDHTARLKRAAVSASDHVICVSNNTRNDLIRLTGVEPEKVSVVHHGANRIISTRTTDVTLPGKPYLLFVGKRDGYKNFSRLQNAFASNNELNTNFSLVCFGGGKFTMKELSAQKHIGLNREQVQWFGGSDAILASLYKNASVFVYPSLYEGFGMPLLEAMSFECPVVCSTGGSITEIAGEAGEFFNPLDIDDLTRAITRVTSDESYATELKLKGINRLVDFSWATCAEKTLDVYRVLSESRN